MKTYRYEISLIDEQTGMKTTKVVSILGAIENRKKRIVTHCRKSDVLVTDNHESIAIQVRDQKIDILPDELFTLIETCLWFNIEKLFDRENKKSKS